MKLAQSWIPLEKIEIFVDLEPAIFILVLSAAAWVVSRILVSKIFPDRRRNLHAHLKNLGYHLLFGLSLFGTYSLLGYLSQRHGIVGRLLSYIGFITIIEGSMIFVKASRILVFEYLFFRYKKVAFPVLLVNLVTLLISITLVGWIGTEIFNIRVAPILATSAIFSLVLGLAMQDTLGNLFAGVALQFDKPYEIGDWIEISNGGQKWVGQIYEITWRATLLIGFVEEFITVPNRVMGQSEISNFSTKYHPIIRTQIFRLPFTSNVPRVKEILLTAVQNVVEIRKNPAPSVLVSETTEAWVAFKLLYFIDNYGEQFRIADRILTHTVTQLQLEGFELAGLPIREVAAHRDVTPK